MSQIEVKSRPPIDSTFSHSAIMDSSKSLNAMMEPNYPHQTVTLYDHSNLIKARETPTRQNKRPNQTSDRALAVEPRPPQSVQSDGSHAKLISRDQCISSTNTITPITVGPADSFLQSEGTTVNRLDDGRNSIRPSNDYVTNSVQPAELHAAVSNQSAESVVCRICHLSATESNSPLDETGCDCRGSLRLCHRRCVEHWMLVKMSKQCEICQQPFKYDIIIPDYQIQGQFSSATRVNGEPGGGALSSFCQDSRRLLFFVIYILLLFTAGSSTTLSICTREEHMKRKPLNVTLANIDMAARNERMYAYGVSLAVTIFVGFHMVAIGVLWVIAEAVVLPRERLLRLHIEIFRDIYAAELQESSYIWRNSGSADPAESARGHENQSAGSGRRGNTMNGQHVRSDESRRVRRPPTPRFREQRRIPEILAHAGNQLALPFSRQGPTRRAPPRVMRRLAEGNRAVASHRHQEGPRPLSEAAQATLDRNIPHEFPVIRTRPGFLEIFALQFGNSISSETTERTETTPGNRQSSGEDERGAEQDPSKNLAEGDHVDQKKPPDIKMQDLSPDEEAFRSEAAACCTAHIISKPPPANSEKK